MLINFHITSQNEKGYMSNKGNAKCYLCISSNGAVF